MAQPELIKDIEARVKKSGDTMTGKLYTTSNLHGSLGSANTNGAFRIDGGTDYQTGAFLSLNGADSTYYPNAFQLVASNENERKELFGNIDGTLTWDNNTILHTGNKNLITADDISASRAHKTSWDFTQQHHSNEVTFDMDNAPGAPSTGWINGFVSTHNNYLSSYIINDHRTSNWYVGYGETVGVNPTWYKLLHSGNYSEYALPLTGGTLTGQLIIESTVSNSWNEGVRINTASNGWTTLILGCSKGSTAGTQEGAWSLHTNNGTFYLSHNGSSSGNPMLIGIKNTGFKIQGTLEVTGLITGTISNADISNRTQYKGDHTEVASNSDTSIWIDKNGMLYPSGLWISGTYNDSATPAQYGNIINIAGRGANQLLLQWATGNGTTTGHVYHRDQRDCAGSGDWHPWRMLWQEGDSITGAVWNDYAEYRESDFIEPGYCLIENGDDTLSKSTERMQSWAGISSDTWGFAQGQTEKAQTPIAVAGRVLVYPYRNRNEYKSGDCVCTAPDGKVDIMTEEEIYKHPDKIIGVVSCVPDYEEWGGGENADRLPVKVDGRIWVRVK